MSTSRILALLLLMFSQPAPAENRDDLVQGELSFQKSCAYIEEMDPGKIVLFQSNEEADQAISQIVTRTGLRKNFRINAGAVQNAAAMIEPPSTRFIVYNPSFMIEVRNSTGNKWAPISILAHEIGHHLQGHTLEQGGSRPSIELEADEYSGFVLQRMGATLADAKIAMEKLGSENGGSTHPARRDRLAAIARGWAAACEQTKCSEPSRPANTPEQDSREEPRASSRSSAGSERRSSRRTEVACRYQNDGECDEPDLCPSGTDVADCRRSVRQDVVTRPPPPPVMPTFCCDMFGRKWCPMAIQLSLGSVCVCPGVPGSGNVCP